MNPQFEDAHIAVTLHDFNAITGIANVLVDEKHDKVGFYYIWVRFVSGDETRVDYDGGNPNREKFLTIRTSHRMDYIRELTAKRVRD